MLGFLGGTPPHTLRLGVGDMVDSGCELWDTISEGGGLPVTDGTRGKALGGTHPRCRGCVLFHLAARSVPILRVLFSGARQRPFLDP